MHTQACVLHSQRLQTVIQHFLLLSFSLHYKAANLIKTITTPFCVNKIDQFNNKLLIVEYISIYYTAYILRMNAYNCILLFTYEMNLPTQRIIYIDQIE